MYLQKLRATRGLGGTAAGSEKTQLKVPWLGLAILGLEMHYELFQSKNSCFVLFFTRLPLGFLKKKSCK